MCAYLLSPLLRRCADTTQPPRQEGSEHSPATGAATANSASSPASTAASASAVPTATTKAGAADSVRRRRVGFEEISPADPPVGSDGPSQGADGAAGLELINVFSWKVLTLPCFFRRARRTCGHCMWQLMWYDRLRCGPMTVKRLANATHAVCTAEVYMFACTTDAVS